MAQKVEFILLNNLEEILITQELVVQLYMPGLLHSACCV